MKKVILLIGGLISIAYGVTYLGSDNFFAPYSIAISFIFGIIAVILGLTLKKK